MPEPFTRRLPLHPETDPCLPLYAVWEVTLRCDQSCHFCGTRAGRAREDELTTDEALDVIRQLAEMGTREIALHGGEAYLRDDFLTIVKAINDRGMHCTMVTGGRGMTPELARGAKEAGVHAISVSVDGCEATHDRLRGLHGSHAGAIKALENLRDAGVKVGCNTQLNQVNFRELPALAQALSKYPIYGWQVQLMVPMGRAADASDLWLQPYDLLELIPCVTETRSLCDRLGIKLWPGDNVGYFGPTEHILRRERARGACPGGCGGGIITIGLEANGDVKGCSAMATEGFVAGNVRKRTIKDMWENAPELRMTRDFKVDDLWGFCRSCYYAEVCKGGCIWTSSTLVGKRGNNPYCYHRALELLATGKRERLTQTRAAAGLIRDRALFALSLEDAPADWVATLPKWQPPPP
jgi:radical SAM protein with 4Fe4S-binding SPASM domain